MIITVGSKVCCEEVATNCMAPLLLDRIQVENRNLAPDKSWF